MRPRLLIPVLLATCAVIAIVTVVALGAYSSTYQPAYDPDRCAIESSDRQQTIASNDYGRVWIKHSAGRTGINDRFYACSNNAGRHHFLATAHERYYEGDEPHPISTIAYDLDSHHAVFAKRICKASDDQRTCGSRIREIRLTDGKDARKPISRAHAFVVDIRTLDRGGPFLYALARSSGHRGCDVKCEIHLVARGHDRVIASGPDIDLESIALSSRHQLYWREAGKPRVKQVP